MLQQLECRNTISSSMHVIILFHAGTDKRQHILIVVNHEDGLAIVFLRDFIRRHGFFF